MTFAALWARAFGLTLLVELVVAVPLLPRGEPPLRRVATVFVAQLASHPLVWFIFPLLGSSRWAYLLGAEGWAIAIELAIYRLVFAELSWSRALAISALSNAASFAAGLVLRG